MPRQCSSATTGLPYFSGDLRHRNGGEKVNRIQQARKEANITAKEMVRRIKRVEPRMDKSLYSKIENGIVRPTPQQLDIICR